MALRRAFLWSMIVSLGAAALLGIVALLFPRALDERILASTAIFGGASLAALLCAVVLEKGRAVPFMWIGIAASAASFGLWVLLVWVEPQWPAGANVARTAGTFSTVAVLGAQSGLLCLLRVSGRAARITLRATIAVSCLLAAHLVVLLWFMARLGDEEMLLRILGVLAILTACGTVVSPILWKVESMRRAPPGEPVPSGVRIEITCPRCGTRQTLPAGDGRCASCGLRIGITLG